MLTLVLQEGLLLVLSPQVILSAARPYFPSKFRGSSPSSQTFHLKPPHLARLWS